jgi:hypothetical protein
VKEELAAFNGTKELRPFPVAFSAFGGLLE